MARSVLNRLLTQNQRISDTNRLQRATKTAVAAVRVIGQA